MWPGILFIELPGRDEAVLIVRGGFGGKATEDNKQNIAHVPTPAQDDTALGVPTHSADRHGYARSARRAV